MTLFDWKEINDESLNYPRRTRRVRTRRRRAVRANVSQRGRRPDPVVSAIAFVGTAAAVVALACASLKLLSLALDTPEEHTEPTRAEAFGVGGGL